MILLEMPSHLRSHLLHRKFASTDPRQVYSCLIRESIVWKAVPPQSWQVLFALAEPRHRAIDVHLVSKGET